MKTHLKRKTVRAEGAERGISATLRLVLVLLSLLLNVAVIFLLSRFLQDRATYVYAGLTAVSVVAAVGIFNRHGSPSYKMLWIFLITAFPVAGLVLYALLGNTGMHRAQGLKNVPEPPVRKELNNRSEMHLQALRKEDAALGRLAAYLARAGFFLYRGTETLYLPSGEAYFEDLFARMEKAERFIFLEYFILAEGELWDRAFHILRDRAAAGVEVKIIFDDFGNINRFGADTLNAMRAAGIDYMVFNPVHRYVNRMYFNYRDHRKIAVVDGNYAYTGGVNFADEYANIIERFGHWRDSAVRLYGAGAWGLTFRFLHLWERLGGSLREEHAFYEPTETAEDTGYVQCVADSPLNNPANPVCDVYMQLIASATRCLYITTPYLSLEDHMVDALCAAADGGVDVRLMLPGIPDKRTVYLVTESYLGDLLRHGVRVYRYTPGFLHNKSVLADGKVALIGSPNFDFRSFQFNFEAAVLCYGTPSVEDLRADMEDIMEKSISITPQAWRKRGLLRRLSESLLRLFAVWM